MPGFVFVEKTCNGKGVEKQQWIWRSLGVWIVIILIIVIVVIFEAFFFSGVSLFLLTFLFYWCELHWAHCVQIWYASWSCYQIWSRGITASLYAFQSIPYLWMHFTHTSSWFIYLIMQVQAGPWFCIFDCTRCGKVFKISNTIYEYYTYSFLLRTVLDFDYTMIS